MTDIPTRRPASRALPTLRASLANPVASAALAAPPLLGLALFVGLELLPPRDAAAILDGRLVMLAETAWWIPTRLAAAALAVLLLAFGIVAATEAVARSARGERPHLGRAWGTALRRPVAVGSAALAVGLLTGLGAAVVALFDIQPLLGGVFVGVAAGVLAGLVPLFLAPAVAVLTGAGLPTVARRAWMLPRDGDGRLVRTRWMIAAVLGGVLTVGVWFGTEPLTGGDPTSSAIAVGLRLLAATVGILLLTGASATIVVDALRDDEIGLAPTPPRGTPIAAAAIVTILALAVVPTLGAVTLAGGPADRVRAATLTAPFVAPDIRVAALGDGSLMTLRGGSQPALGPVRVGRCDRERCRGVDIADSVAGSLDVGPDGAVTLAYAQAVPGPDDRRAWALTVNRISSEQLAAALDAALTSGGPSPRLELPDPRVLATVPSDIADGYDPDAFATAVDASGPTPVVALAVRPQDGPATMTGYRCADADCTSADAELEVTTDLGEQYDVGDAARLHVRAGSDGIQLLATALADDDRLTLSRWSSSNPAGEDLVDLGVGGGFASDAALATVAEGADGAFFVAGRRVSEAEIEVSRCDDSGCAPFASAGAVSGDLETLPLVVDETGRPMWAERADGILWLASCVDDTCSDVERRALAPVAAETGSLALTLGPDGTPIVFAGAAPAATRGDDPTPGVIVWCEQARCGAD